MGFGQDGSISPVLSGISSQNPLYQGHRYETTTSLDYIGVRVKGAPTALLFWSYPAMAFQGVWWEGSVGMQSAIASPLHMCLCGGRRTSMQLQSAISASPSAIAARKMEDYSTICHPMSLAVSVSTSKFSLENLWVLYRQCP